MPHLRSVKKGALEVVTSPMRDNYMIKFYPLKSLKFWSFRGLRPLDPHLIAALWGKKTQPEFLDPPLKLNAISRWHRCQLHY